MSAHTITGTVRFFLLALAGAALLFPFPVRAEESVANVKREFESRMAATRADRTELDATYEKALTTQQDAFQSAGNLKGTLEVRKELKGFRDQGQRTLSDLPEVKRLQEIYDAQRAKLKAKERENALEVLTEFETRLKDLSVALTEANRIDEALEALGESKRIGALKKESGVASGGGQAGPMDTAKGVPFVNSLDLRFVAVPIGGGPTKGRTILFSIWETRVRDYTLFARRNRKTDGAWEAATEGKYRQEKDHPAVNVSWNDANAFCAWLTETERGKNLIGAEDVYRLPLDVEWSYAVGIGGREKPEDSPGHKSNVGIADVYPWGSSWPPPEGSGNFAGDECASETTPRIEGYHDDFPFTAPVGQFPANRLGLHDMGGNVCEWSADLWTPDDTRRATRDSSWQNCSRANVTSATRNYLDPGARHSYVGFRVVLERKAGR